MSFFFISYKHSVSEDFVEQLELRFAEAGLLVWRDNRIRASEEWKRMIDLALDGCCGMILVLTREALNSPYVNYEWAYAVGNGKRIIPILIDPTISHDDLHPRLKDFQTETYQNTSAFWDRLIETATKIRGEAIETPLAVSSAVAAMNSANPDERWQAVEVLGMYDLPNRNPAVIKALAEATNHGYLDVRLYAGLLLAERTNYEDERAIPALNEWAVAHFQLDSPSIFGKLALRGNPKDIFHLVLSKRFNSNLVSRFINAMRSYALGDLYNSLVLEAYLADHQLTLWATRKGYFECMWLFGNAETLGYLRVLQGLLSMYSKSEVGSLPTWVNHAVAKLVQRGF